MRSRGLMVMKHHGAKKVAGATLRWTSLATAGEGGDQKVAAPTGAESFRHCQNFRIFLPSRSSSNRGNQEDTIAFLEGAGSLLGLRGAGRWLQRPGIRQRWRRWFSARCR